MSLVPPLLVDIKPCPKQGFWEGWGDTGQQCSLQQALSVCLSSGGFRISVPRQRQPGHRGPRGSEGWGQGGCVLHSLFTCRCRTRASLELQEFISLKEPCFSWRK